MGFSNKDLLTIAQAQKNTIYVLLLDLLSLFFLHIILFPLLILYAHRLASSVRMPNPWIYALGMIVPAINILLLLLLSEKANIAFKEEGLRVGLLGASIDQIRSRIERDERISAAKAKGQV